MSSLDINDAMSKWADQLASTNQEKSSVRKELNVVVNLLKSEGKNFDFDRVEISGSFVYGTSISGEQEVDLIAFINREPPFSSFATQIASTISMHYRWQPEMHPQVIINQLGVVCVSLNALRIHVHFAKNFLKAEEKGLGVKAQYKRQHDRSVEWLKHLKNQPQKVASMSTWLSCTACEFYAEQLKDPAVLQLIRLCRKWNSSISGLPQVYKRVSVIELLAFAAAAQEKQKRGAKTLLVNRFRRFLENWLSISAGSFSYSFSFSAKHEIYAIRDVPSSIRDDRPLLLDPIDPFCNRLRSIMDAKVLQAFFECAQETLRRLDRAEAVQAFDFDKIFTPQDVSSFLSTVS